MQEVFKKIIEQLDELIDCNPIDGYEKGKNCGVSQAIEIVEQEAEKYTGLALCKTREFFDYQFIKDDGWIPCSSGKLPKENEYVRVTIWCGHEWIGCYRDGRWFVYGADGLTEATVLAWQPTEPYQPKGE